MQRGICQSLLRHEPLLYKHLQSEGPARQLLRPKEEMIKEYVVSKGIKRPNTMKHLTFVTITANYPRFILTRREMIV